jgi:replicative DNA helicase
VDFFGKMDALKIEMRQDGGYAKLSDVMRSVISSLERKEGTEFHFSLSELNRHTGGLARGELLLVGGFTAQGKSSLCLQMAVDLAEQGKRVLFCSSEMSEFEMARRVLGSYSGIRILDLRRAEVDGEGIEKLRSVTETLESLQIAITLITNVGQVKRAIIGYKPEVVFIDHLHNLQGKGRNPYEKTTQNIKDLKEIALTEKIGMVVASQLHRPQDDKLRPPRISDLRESGTIEETANAIILLYWKNQRENEEISETEEMEIRLVKNRDGRTGRFSVIFEPELCRFRDWFEESSDDG